MKFSICVDNSDVVRDWIKDSVDGKEIHWDFGSAFDHATVLEVKEGERFNVVHLTGSVISYLRYKLLYLQQRVGNGCFIGWELPR